MVEACKETEQETGSVDLSGLHITPATDQDRLVLAAQLGRSPRGVLGIAHRCVCGNPAVVATAPRLENQAPFPTCFYLTLPALNRVISKLEAEKQMVGYNQLLADDPQLAAQYRQAHQHYLAARRQIAAEHGYEEVPEIAQVSAGGLPDRVKCLHALVGHALAAGAGINPIGDLVLARLASENSWHSTRCDCEPLPASEPTSDNQSGVK